MVFFVKSLMVVTFAIYALISILEAMQMAASLALLNHIFAVAVWLFLIFIVLTWEFHP